MKDKKISEIMVPLSDHITISDNDSLHNAMKLMSEHKTEFERDHYKHHHEAILVLNEIKEVVGKISQFDIIRSLEPKYTNIFDDKNRSKFYLSRAGISSEFFKSMMSHYDLWDESLSILSKKASKIKVKDFMYTPASGEYVKLTASFDQAAHQIVIGHHHSLLVVKDEKIIGVLRLCDIFTEICNSVL